MILRVHQISCWALSLVLIPMVAPTSVSRFNEPKRSWSKAGVPKGKRRIFVHSLLTADPLGTDTRSLFSFSMANVVPHGRPTWVKIDICSLYLVRADALSLLRNAEKRCRSTQSGPCDAGTLKNHPDRTTPACQFIPPNHPNRPVCFRM